MMLGDNSSCINTDENTHQFMLNNSKFETVRKKMEISKVIYQNIIFDKKLEEKL